MAKYSRTTISIPPDLKARMDAVEEPVNWSAVACLAFEQKLAEIARRKETRDMREVIARLRASKARSAEDDYQEGFEEGRGWAMTRAEAAELEDLAAWREQAGLDWELHFDRTVSDAYSPGEILVFAISPERNGDREIAREFWEGNVSSPHLSLKSEFVRGFAEGALDLWKEVSDQL